MRFPISGVEVFPLLPALVSFAISSITATAGVSGAFVLLPFQISVLGFVSPAVTPTNHLFNVVAIPSGVYRYAREGRMLWPLAVLLIIGTVPGVIAGSVARIYLLADPRDFKLFAAIVLLFIASRLVSKAARSSTKPKPSDAPTQQLQVTLSCFDWRQLQYLYAGETFTLSSIGIGVMAATIGAIGGAFGVGGGAIIAPILVSFYKLPVQTIAGATLMSTCVTSVVGVITFAAIGPLVGRPGITPDWLLGGLLGVGGMAGMYCGARLQRYLPTRLIEATLGLLVTAMALRYVVAFFAP